MAAILRANVRRATSALIPLSSKPHIKLAERTHPTVGSSRRSLEDILHLMVVILIQTTELRGLLGTLQLSANIAILRTVVGLNAQSTISPSSGRCEWDRCRESDAEEFRGLMFPALRQ